MKKNQKNKIINKILKEETLGINKKVHNWKFILIFSYHDVQQMMDELIKRMEK